jgi:hypothetical protein
MNADYIKKTRFLEKISFGSLRDRIREAAAGSHSPVVHT